MQYFSKHQLILVQLWDQASFAYFNHARIRSWNQPVLSNEGTVSCSQKHREPLMGLELTTVRLPSTTRQTRYQLHHAASVVHKLRNSVLHPTFSKFRRRVGVAISRITCLMNIKFRLKPP